MSPNLRGILLMIASMVLFAVEDAFIKLAAGEMPVGQVVLLIGLAGLLVYALAAARMGESIFQRRAFAAPVMLRSLFELIGSLGMVMALALIPLSTMSAILQASPILMTAAAALFLGEQVGWRRWAAVLVGFTGVMLIVQPGGTAFDPNVLWAVLGVAGMTGRDLAARRMDPGVPTPVVASWGYMAVILMGIGLLLQSGGAEWPPSGAGSMLVAGAIAVGLAAYWALIEATRAGDVVVIVPFRYTRLVFALGLGALIFGERPTGTMLLGAALVVASGLYTLYRERRRALEGAPRAEPHGTAPEARP
jgi:drug/metabolite transporter (DMT)-like permease